MNLQINKDRLYYFASPYSHKNPFVQNMRYETTIFAASQLTAQGYRLLEPIAMCHEQASRYGLPAGYEFWKTRDRGFIDISDGVIVLTLPGWKKSVGVMDEIKYAESTGKWVHYLDPESIISSETWAEIHR